MIINGGILELLNREGLNLFNPFTETLYKYVSADTAKLILSNSKLQFSIASSFNDPFELTLDNYDFKPTTDDIKALIDRTVIGSTEEKQRFYQERKHNVPLAIEALKSALTKLKDTVGICCFSSHYNKTLMWSHYADNHKGVCLGFKNFTSAEDFFILHVRYLEELRKLDFWKLREQMFPLWVFSKSHVWKYEEEIRAVHTEFNGLLTFDKRCLVEIFYGVRTRQKDIEDIKFILKEKEYSNVHQSHLVIDPATYDIAKADTKF